MFNRGPGFNRTAFNRFSSRLSVSFGAEYDFTVGVKLINPIAFAAEYDFEISVNEVNFGAEYSFTVDVKLSNDVAFTAEYSFADELDVDNCSMFNRGCGFNRTTFNRSATSRAQAIGIRLFNAVSFDAEYDISVTPKTINDIDFTGEYDFTVSPPNYSIPIAFIGEYGFTVTPKFVNAIDFSSEYDFTITQKMINAVTFGAEYGLTVSPPNYTINLSFDAEYNLDVDVNGPYVDLNNFKWIEASITKSVQNPVGTIVIQIDKNEVPPSSLIAFLEIDYLGRDYVLFCGKMKDPKYSIRVANNRVQMIGYEFGYYLANQYLNMYNNAPNLVYNPDDTYFDWTRPDYMIKYWLGGYGEHPYGADWAFMTGINPYRINPLVPYGHTYTEKEFVFDSNTPKCDAIKEVTNYCNCVFIIKALASTTTKYAPNAYWVHEDDLDEANYGLDIPFGQTFTNPDPHVIEVVPEYKDSEEINRVIVRGQNDNGTWVSATVESAEVTAGTELPIEYYEESSDYDTTPKCLTRATELYNEKHTTVVNITAKLNKYGVRLQLYQNVRFLGYDDVPEDWMRITAITYNLKPAGDAEVEITCSTNIRDSGESDYWTDEIKNISKEIIEFAQSGTVASVTGVSGTVTLDKGGIMAVRFLKYGMSIGDTVVVIPSSGGQRIAIKTG